MISIYSFDLQPSGMYVWRWLLTVEKIHDYPHLEDLLLEACLHYHHSIGKMTCRLVIQEHYSKKRYRREMIGSALVKLKPSLLEVEVKSLSMIEPEYHHINDEYRASKGRLWRIPPIIPNETFDPLTAEVQRQHFPTYAGSSKTFYKGRGEELYHQPHLPHYNRKRWIEEASRS